MLGMYSYPGDESLPQEAKEIIAANNPIFINNLFMIKRLFH